LQRRKLTLLFSFLTDGETEAQDNEVIDLPKLELGFEPGSV
jgi:hypothetical protein